MAPEKRFMGLSQVFHGIFMKLHLVLKGNRTISIVNGTEGYQTIKVSFGSLFKEINSLIDSARSRPQH